MLAFYLALLLFVVQLQSVASCNATTVPGSSWSCYTVAPHGESIASIASVHGLSPFKLCDFNKRETKCEPSTFSSSTLRPGQQVRIPENACDASVRGHYTCYTAVQGDSLETIARDHSNVRSVSLLMSWNQDALWGQNHPTPGLRLRLPAFYCYPTLAESVCHTVKAGESLQGIAAHFGVDVPTLLSLGNNSVVITGDPKSSFPAEVRAGQEINVPELTKPAPATTGRRDCQPTPGVYGCVTVKFNDTLWTIAQAVGVDPYSIAEINDMPECLPPNNCTDLEVGWELAFPIAYSGDGGRCVDRPGAWTCWTAPPYNDPGSPPSLDHGPYPISIVTGYAKRSLVAGGSARYTELLYRFNRQQFSKTACSRHSKYTSKYDCEVYVGMTIRLPHLHCVPDMGIKCHTATQGESLYSISQTYQTGAGNVVYTSNGVDQYYNFIVVGAVYSVRAGMSIAIPRPKPNGPMTNFTASCRDVPGKSFCYKAFFYDTIFDLGARLSVPWRQLCSYNRLENCDCVCPGPSCNVFFQSATAISVPVSDQEAELQSKRMITAAGGAIRQGIALVE